MPVTHFSQIEVSSFATRQKRRLFENSYTHLRLNPPHQVQILSLPLECMNILPLAPFLSPLLILCFDSFPSGTPLPLVLSRISPLGGRTRLLIFSSTCYENPSPQIHPSLFASDLPAHTSTLPSPCTSIFVHTPRHIELISPHLQPVTFRTYPFPSVPMAAYTNERFKRALDVFLTTEPPQVREPTLEELFGSPSGYDLRPRARNGNSRHTVACVDDDDTEDYDPSKELSPRKRKPTSNATSHAHPRAPKRAQTATTDSGALQQELVDGAVTQRQFPSMALSYNFRPRTRASTSSERAIENTVTTPTKTAPSALIPNPLLSPKNCLACLELELKCSLEQNPLSYPCTNCRDDNLDCVVQPPPTWKRPCEKCKSRHRGQSCSYSRYDYDHSKPCQFCQDRGFDCVAGPAKEQPSVRQKDGHETDEATSRQEAAPSSKIDAVDGSSFPFFVDIHETTDFDPAYQLTTDVEPAANDSPKLKNPLKTPPETGQFTCVDLVESDPFALINNAASLAGSTGRSSPVELSEFDFGLDNNNTGVFSGNPPDYALTFHCPNRDLINELKPRLVRTELSHPLKVNHDPSPEGEQEGQACHWCDNFAYGIMGLGVRHPEIIETCPGEWFELRDGHTHEGRDPSRMCIQCTFKRISILLCSHGSFMPFVDPKDVDADLAYAQLINASRALHPEFHNPDWEFKEPYHPWCSLCRAPAFWRCNEPHPITEETFSTIPTDPGCGLHLCDYCASLATGCYGDLDAVVASGLRDPEKETEYRADVDLILSHSEDNVLWQQVCGKG